MSSASVTVLAPLPVALKESSRYPDPTHAVGSLGPIVRDFRITAVVLHRGRHRAVFHRDTARGVSRVTTPISVGFTPLIAVGDIKNFLRFHRW